MHSPKARAGHLPDARNRIWKRKLGPGHAEIWLARTDSLSLTAATERYAWLCDKEERLRFDRFVSRSSKLQFLISRALLRKGLSSFADVDPREWRYAPDSGGKPRLTSPLSGELMFNISHTDGLVACAFAFGAEVGVDVEDINRPNDIIGFRQQFLSSREEREIDALPEGNRRSAIYSYWTLKEAYLKGTGVGLSGELRETEFIISGNSAMLARPSLDSQKEWHFCLKNVAPKFSLALAANLPAGCGLEVQLRVPAL